MDILNFAATFDSVSEAIKEIKVLNQEAININDLSFDELKKLNNSLVSFHGMMQDSSMQPEMYPLKWKSKDLKTTMFTDDYPEEIYESEILEYASRYPQYLISIPGLELPLNAWNSNSNLKRFPLDKKHQIVLAKFYEQPDIKICDQVQIYGILHIDKEISIHVIYSKIPQENAEFNLMFRQPLIDVIGSYLQDKVAAEHLMLHCLHFDEKRNRGPLVLGNITQVDLGLFKLMSQIFGPTVYIDVNLESLNSSAFCPKYIDDLGFSSGSMQFANESILVLDETKLCPGQLMNQGVLNVNFISNIFSLEILECEFLQSKIEIPINYKCVILCSGSKSIFVETLNTYSLKKSQTKMFEANIQDLKNFVISVKQIHCQLDETMAKVIEDYFAEQKCSALHLDLLITRAKRIGSSLGLKTITKEVWQHAINVNGFY